MTTAKTPTQKKKDRQFNSAKDFETVASQIGEVEPFTEQQRQRARLIVASNAAGDTFEDRVADADDLIRMLGLHPDQETGMNLGLTIPSPGFQLKSTPSAVR